MLRSIERMARCSADLDPSASHLPASHGTVAGLLCSSYLGHIPQNFP